MDPPKKYKCGCLPGYDAVLPNPSEIIDNVTADWRPLMCVPRDVCVGVVCHEDATCSVSSKNTAVCSCIDGLVGDGIMDCSPPPTPKQVVKKPTSPPSACKSDKDCTESKNTVCVLGSCECKSDYFRIYKSSPCLSENQCADGYPNDCHKNADCTPLEGTYACTCKDGYKDLKHTDKPGTVCAQINECLDHSMNDCDIETQVCVDHPPPLKWQCIQRTIAPTPAPTAFCYNDQTGMALDRGCTSAKPFCVADPGKGGVRCTATVVCNSNERSNAVLVSFEDFETESTTGWTSGNTVDSTSQASFTKFLGRISKGQTLSKTWQLPSATDSVRVTFQFYEIDTWDGDSACCGKDKFFVRVNNNLVDLGFFAMTTSEAASGNAGGILWSHTYTTNQVNLGFSPYADQKHNVVLDIPSSYLSAGNLKLEFEASIDESLSLDSRSDSAGIDDLRIVACPAL